jgi:uncharacterized phage protein (TIGR01671 family)
MKREIKFRAYWTLDKSTHYNDVSEFVSFNDDGSINNSCGSGIVHVMQFTGLKDKNGKEIYEGDIVRFKISSTKDEPLITHLYFPVGFYDGMYCLEMPEGTYPLDAYIHQEAEVIGNIYENPELIKSNNP